MAATAEAFNVLYPQLSGIDFRADVPTLGVPVYIVEGRHEAAGRETLTRAWYDLLDAPSKNYHTLSRHATVAFPAARGTRGERTLLAWCEVAAPSPSVATACRSGAKSFRAPPAPAEVMGLLLKGSAIAANTLREGP